MESRDRDRVEREQCKVYGCAEKARQGAPSPHTKGQETMGTWP